MSERGVAEELAQDLATAREDFRPSAPAPVPHRPRVLVWLADGALAAELVRHLAPLGLEAVAAASEEQAVRLLTSERPVERVVVGDNLPLALRSALRSVATPPLLIQLAPATEVPP